MTTLSEAEVSDVTETMAWSPTGISQTFRLTPPEQRRMNLRGTCGQTEVVWRIRNQKGHPTRGRLDIAATGAAQVAWCTIVGETVRDFRSREALDFHVRISIPPETSSNVFEFSATAISEADPERDFTDPISGTVTIEWEPLPVVRRISKWKLAVIILIPLLFLTTLAYCLYRYFHSEPRHLLAEVNAYAADSDWESYWNCWSPQGQHKLVYWQGYELREAALENPEWREELRSWLPTFGLTLQDLDTFEREPGQVNASEATERSQSLLRKTLEHGRSGMSFFIAAATWNQISDQDWERYQLQKKSDASGDDGLLSKEQMQNFVRDQFRFLLLCEKPVSQKMTSQMREYLAVPIAEVSSQSSIEDAAPCLSCSDAEVDISRAAQAPLPRAQEFWNQNRQQAVLLTFVNRDGAWLLDGFASADAAAVEFRTSTRSQTEDPAATPFPGTLRRVTMRKDGAAWVDVALYFSQDHKEVLGTVEKISPGSSGTDVQRGQIVFIEDGQRKSTDEYEFSTLGSDFLKVQRYPENNESNDIVWLSRKAAQPSADVFLGMEKQLAVELLGHITDKIRFLDMNIVVEQDSIAPTDIVSGFYVESEPGPEPPSGRQRIRRLLPADRVPVDQLIYLEFVAPAKPE